MKRLFSSIRPPGAPTSIRPPKRGSIRPPKRGSYTSPSGSGRVRRPDRSGPPGQRRPRASRASRASRRSRGPRRPSAALFVLIAIATALIVIVTALSAAGEVLSDLIEASRPRVATAPTSPTRTAQARRTPSPSPAPSDGSAAYAGSWQEAWSLDESTGDGTATSGTDDDTTTFLYAFDDRLVVAHRYGHSSTSHADVTGYLIKADGPERAWTITMNEFTRHPVRSGPWGSKLIMGGELVDVITGEVSDAPWKHASPKFTLNGFVIVCDDSDTWCAGWDWNDGNPSERWRSGPLEEDLQSAQVVGDDATGHIRIQRYTENRSSDRSRRSGSSTSGTSTVGFLSLADGSIHNSSSKAGRATYVPAADGWLRRSDDGSGFEMLSPDGAPAGTIESATADDEYLVLLSPTGPPTLDEHRRAYELGDTGWAATVLTATRDGRSRPQLLNGRPLVSGTSSIPRVPAVSEGNRALLSPDGRTLLVMGASDGAPRVSVDLATSTITDLPPETTEKVGVKIARADLIVAVVGTRIVGYAPTG